MHRLRNGRLLLAVVFAVFGLLTPSCDWFEETQPELPDIFDPKVFPLKCELRLEDEEGRQRDLFSTREPINVVLTVTNIGSEEFFYEWPDSYWWDGSVRNAAGEIVWRFFPRDIFFGPHPLRLAPGESTGMRYRWTSWTGLDAKWLPPGTYSMLLWVGPGPDERGLSYTQHVFFRLY